MKKLLFISKIFVLALAMASLASCHNNGNDKENESSEVVGDTADGYVDLGLPSGTKWKTDNETGGDNGIYTYEEAVSAFGDQLPTKEQLEELKLYCTWEWQQNVGYKVTGANKKSIVLPAAGSRDCGGYVYGVRYDGRYWSSTPVDSANAWYLEFYSDKVEMDSYVRCYGFSVRLVQD